MSIIQRGGAPGRRGPRRSFAARVWTTRAARRPPLRAAAKGESGAPLHAALENAQAVVDRRGGAASRGRASGWAPRRVRGREAGLRTVGGGARPLLGRGVVPRVDERAGGVLAPYRVLDIVALGRIRLPRASRIDHCFDSFSSDYSL